MVQNTSLHKMWIGIQQTGVREMRNGETNQTTPAGKIFKHCHSQLKFPNFGTMNTIYLQTFSSSSLSDVLPDCSSSELSSDSSNSRSSSSFSFKNL